MTCKIQCCIFTLVVFMSLSVMTISAQYVYGNSTTKNYYSIDCEVEIGSIEKGYVVGFKTAAAAEKAGYVRGKTCTRVPPKTPEKVDWDSVAGIKSGPIEIKKGVDKVTILYVKNNLDRYFGQVVNLRVSISQSGGGFFPYKKGLSTYSMFDISDDTNTGYVYMKNASAKKLVDQISLAPYARMKGIATIHIRRELFDIMWPGDGDPVYLFDRLQGELLAFKVEQ